MNLQKNRIYPVDIFVYNHIKFFCEKGQGSCFQSNEKIGEKIGRHKTNISRAITKLNNLGYIKIERENGRKLTLSTKEFGYKNVDNLAKGDDKVAMLIDILALEFDKLAMDRLIISLRGVDNLAKHNIEYKLRYLNLEFKKENTKESEIMFNNINLNNSFDEFWNIYPNQRKGSKQNAFKAYCKAIKEKRTDEKCLYDAVVLYSKSDTVANGYAKGCASWLNDDRFNDNYAHCKTKLSKSEEITENNKRVYLELMEGLNNE